MQRSTFVSLFRTAKKKVILCKRGNLSQFICLHRKEILETCLSQLLKSVLLLSAVSSWSRLIFRSDGFQFECPPSPTILFQNSILFLSGKSSSPTFISSPNIRNRFDKRFCGSQATVTSFLEASGVGFPCFAMLVKNLVRFLLTLRSLSVFKLLGNPATEKGNK